MARPAGSDRIEIREGLYIYLRHSPVWQVYFKLKGSKKTVRRSLGTRNLIEARRLALEEYDQARLRQMTGRPELGVGFKRLSEEYLASLPTGGSKTYHTDIVHRLLSPFFTMQVPDFSEVTEADILDYIQWRRENGKTRGQEPKAQTLNRQNVVLKGLIKFAVTRGYLTKNDAPNVTALKATTNRRPNFTRAELKTLLKAAKARADETLNAATKEQRRLLYDWIAVMANTGLRPKEAKSLTWANVFLDIEEPYIHIIRAKTKARDVVPMDLAIDHLRAIRERQKAYLAGYDMSLSGEMFVFSLPNTTDQSFKPVQSFKTAFNSLVKSCAFERDQEIPLSPYSLRHSYATMRLEEGTNIYVLKDQMGTSVRMIEDHYGHVITREQRDELTKVRDKSKLPQADMTAFNEKFDQIVKDLKQDKEETLEQIGRRFVLKRWEEENGNPPSPEDEEIVDGLVHLWIKSDGKDPFKP